MSVFEWDPAKAAANLAKHGVRFASAVQVFFDDRALSEVDEHEVEERFVIIGMDDLGRVLVVVYAWRQRRIRIISARKATKHERAQYEEGS